MRGLAGKRVIVTGGSSGIGEATVQRFLEEGARVMLCGLEAEEVSRAVGEKQQYGEVHGTACDLTAEGDVERLMSETEDAIGPVDILVNNAGTAWREPFLEITPAHWDQMITTNLRSMFLVAQAVARSLVSREARGAIINMSSTNGLGGEADYTHYNASKAGVLLLTKTMAVELGRHGIRVNAVCPGSIRTPLNNKNRPTGRPESAFLERPVQERIPLGRVGEASEVAAAYAFLASDDASFISGAELVIDGGQIAIM